MVSVSTLSLYFQVVYGGLVDVGCLIKHNIFFVILSNSITSDWNQPLENLRAAGLTRKKATLYHIENRKLNILDRLKLIGGQFSTAKEVEQYLDTTNENEQFKTKRIRDEVTYMPGTLFYHCPDHTRSSAYS